MTMANPGNHTFRVVMEYKTGPHETSILKMPAWSPGYYQIMDFVDGVTNFVAKDEEGKTLEFEKKGKNAWQIEKGEASVFSLRIYC